MNAQIIGLSGTNGSGKDTAGAILADHYGYLFVSVTDLLREELRRRGEPVEREYTRALSAEWRRKYGGGVLVDRAVAMWQPQRTRYPRLVLSSLRNPAEADRVHELGGVVAWVDADPRVRYERIQSNKAQRGRPGEDHKTFEEFMAEEAAEMNAPAGSDAAFLDMTAVKQRADVLLMNEGVDLDGLRLRLENALGLTD